MSITMANDHETIVTSKTNPWDKFAKNDPTFYIATRTRWRWREEDAFWKSGEQTVRFIWNCVTTRLTRRQLAIEIGCGIGRLAVPMAKQFARVKVVDASPAMLEQLKIKCQRFGVCNVESFLQSSAWHEEPADFIFSALCFQHIEAMETIEEYMEKIAQCLTRDGIAFLQFDTRSRSAYARWKERWPDAWWVPRTMQRGMRRYRRDSRELRDLFARHGLRVVQERDPDSPLHSFVLTR